jgi:hypothetical protein
VPIDPGEELGDPLDRSQHVMAEQRVRRRNRR